MHVKTGSVGLMPLGLLTLCLGTPAPAQTAMEPLPPLPAVESLYTTGSAPQVWSQVDVEAPAKTVTFASVAHPADRPALYEVPTKAAPVAPAPSLLKVQPAHPVAAMPGASAASTPVIGPVSGMPTRAVISSATPAYAPAVPQNFMSVPTSALVGAIRIGAATGGPSLRDVVPRDVGDVVFTSASDLEPANGWFTRTYRAALKRGGLMASKPELARYELTAEVRSMAITPLLTGARHRSIVIYRLRDIAKGIGVWEQTQATDLEVARGMRFGAIGGALGAALGGAIAGQNPAVTSQMITNQRGRRPFDVRIDVYEGIMRGFQEMARNSVAELTTAKARQ